MRAELKDGTDFLCLHSAMQCTVLLCLRPKAAVLRLLSLALLVALDRLEDSSFGTDAVVLNVTCFFQPLSLLLKLNPRVTELTCYDVSPVTPGNTDLHLFLKIPC